MHRNLTIVSPKQERIAALAKQSPQMAFTSLAYLMDLDWLREAYRRTRKDGAVGVDGVSAEDCERDLEGNLQRLLDRAKSGTYQDPPVRRVHFPKCGSGTETRPLGIPTLEDKILQRAVVMLLERIYKLDFLERSDGFLPRAIGTSGVGSFPEPVDELSGRLCTLSGYLEVFRQSGSRPLARVSSINIDTRFNELSRDDRTLTTAPQSLPNCIENRFAVLKRLNDIPRFR